MREPFGKMRAWLEYRPKGRNFANENNSDRRRKRQNEALNFLVYFFVSRQRSKWVWARPSKKINNPF
jgi:hypothetical protein